jgi:hypothetical protein
MEINIKGTEPAFVPISIINFDEQNHLSTLLPFLNLDGEFVSDKIEPFDGAPMTDDDIPTRIMRGGNECVEVRYGLLAVIQLVGKCLQIPTPKLDNLLNPLFFHSKLLEIAHFYTSDSAKVEISSVDAFNYLRFAAVFADQRAWVSLLTVADSTMGKSVKRDVSDLKNISKNSKGYWLKPDFMFDLAKEFKQIREKVLRANMHLVEDATNHEEATELYQAILKTCQLWLNVNFINAIKSEKPDAEVVSVDCRSITFRGVLKAEKDMFLLGRANNYIHARRFENIAYVYGDWLGALPTTSTRGVLKYFKKTEIYMKPV